jgi:hypothetical protein
MLSWGTIWVVQAQVRPPSPTFVPPCDLAVLNREYITRLNRLRRQLNPAAPLVQLDPNLFVGSVLHVAKMEEKDSLVHAYSLKYFAELIGAKKYVQTGDAGRIAQFALGQFEGSEQHCQIQESLNYTRVSIACSKNYYIVRLADKPLAADKAEQAALKKLGVKQLVGEEDVKPARPIIYRPF